MGISTKYRVEAGGRENWQKQVDVITHDDVISAYLHGKRAGRNQWQIAMLNLFEQNLTKAQEVSEKLNESLKLKGISVSNIYLKADTATEFMALFIVSTEDYVSEKFLEGIKAGRTLKEAFETPQFSINFIYTHNADSLNTNCLDSDGYFLKYYAH